MNKTNINIPIDIESILTIDKEKWYEDFEWPIKWHEFIEIENGIKSILNSHIDRFPRYANIIVINFKIHIEYSNFLVALLLKKELNTKAIVSTQNNYYRSIFDRGIPVPFVKFPKINKENNNFLRRKIRSLKKFLVDNNFKFPFFWKTKIFILNESRSPSTLDFLRKNYKGRIHSLSFFDYFDEKNNYEIDCQSISDIKEIIGSIIQDISNYALNLGVILNKKQKDFLNDHMFNLFTKSLRSLNIIKTNIRNKKVKLFLGSNNSYYSRIMSAAVREANGEVHGFQHGEPINYKIDLVSWLDLSLNNYFYTYTDENALTLRDIVKEFPPLNHNKCIIKSMENDAYSGLFKHFNINGQDKISTVTLIGNCFRHTSFSSATAVFPTMQLYTELFIIKKLQAEGYKVIYKMHPENLNEKIGFVKDISVFQKLFPKDVEINTENFELMEHKTDAFVFYYTATSTFLSALTSNKPILFYDIGLRKYPKNMLDLLMQRCDYKLTKLNFI